MPLVMTAEEIMILDNLFGHMCFRPHHRDDAYNLHLLAWCASEQQPMYVPKKKGRPRGKPSACPYCWAWFEKRRDLEKHFKDAHPKIMPYMCCVCLKPYFTRNSLSAHMHQCHQL